MFRPLFIMLCLSAALCARPIQEGTWTALADQTGGVTRIGILCGHPKEAEAIAASLHAPVIVSQAGRRDYHQGELHGHQVVLAVTRPGKVAAATAATQLIVGYDCDLIVLIGVCGALDSSLSCGDMVIGASLLQHDLDCSPLTPPAVIPILNVRELYPDAGLQKLASEAAKMGAPPSTQIVQGQVLTGDQFISSHTQRSALISRFPDAQVVEMEGAAVGQVCFEYNVPLVLVRIVGDQADEWAPADCMRFVYEIAAPRTRSFINHFIGLLPNHR